MTPEEIIQAIHPRIKDDAQRHRLNMLAARIVGAFGSARTAGVKSAMEQDWAELKARFDATLQKVKTDTGVF